MGLGVLIPMWLFLLRSFLHCDRSAVYSLGSWSQKSVNGLKQVCESKPLTEKVWSTCQVKMGLN